MRLHLGLLGLLGSDSFRGCGELGADIFLVACAFVEVEPGRVVVFVKVYCEGELGLSEYLFDDSHFRDVICFKCAVDVYVVPCLTRFMNVAVRVDTRNYRKGKLFQECGIVAFEEL